MIIAVRVNTRAKRNAVEKIGDNAFKIWVTIVPEHGKANEKVVDLLADFFDTAKSNIRIISGETSRDKKIEVDV